MCSLEILTEIKSNTLPKNPFFFRISFQYTEPSGLNGDLQEWQWPIRKILQNSILRSFNL